MASAIAASSTVWRTISTGMSGAFCCFTFMMEARSTLTSSVKAISISGLSCVKASPKSLASDSQVQWTG